MDKIEGGEVISFDVKARMEEKERRSDRFNVGFTLSVGTKPNVAKYEVEGEALLEGKSENINGMLEVDPDTQIPFVFQKVYQHIFMSIYLLATLIEAPYPPPNLLFSNSDQSSMAQIDASIAAANKQSVQPTSSTVPKEETMEQPAIGAMQEETTTPEEEQAVGSPAAGVRQNSVVGRDEGERV